MKPHIHVEKSARKAGSYDAVFAIELTGCVSERGEPRDETEITQRAMRRQVDFVNALFASDVDHTFAIRFFSRRRSSSVSSGKIDVTLFGRVTEKGKANSIGGAIELCRETTALLAAAMPNHLWQIVSDPTLFKQLWQPFPLERASICEIRRREDMVSLVTMRSKGPLGFASGSIDLATESLDENSIYFVHQFLPRPSTFARLLRTLLLHRWAVMLQITVKPTRLNEAEKRALEEQITRCEQSQSDILVRHSPGDDPIIHRARANLWYEALVAQSLRLQDAPYRLQISLASPHRIPRTIAEAVGVEMTRPIGDHLTPEGANPQAIQLHQLQGGGYDAVFPRGAEELAEARENVALMDFSPWGLTCSPESLGRLRQLVDSGEAAGAFRVPIATAGGIDGIEVRAARFRPQPLEVASGSSRPQKQRLLLGENISLGLRQPVFMPEHDRHQHTYVLGQTGTGKTSLLRTMILSDMKAGKGMAVLDPHGDLFHELLARIPKNRWDDVVVFDPTDSEFALGLNLLECRNEEERHFVVREMRAIMERLLEDQYQYKAAEYTGPVFYQHMQMNMLLGMSDPDNPGTLLEFYEIYQQRNYWKRWLPLKWKDAQLSRWVTSNLPAIDYLKRNSDNSPTWGEYLSSKFDDFVFDPRLRLIFGQKRSTIDLRRIMDQGKILLVNLAKGELSEPNSRFLGMALMAKIQAAAMSRSDIPVAKRRPFYLYVDEFQSIATQNFITLLSEGRKFGIALVLANQFLSQIKDERIMQSVTGNVGTNICFRVGREDAKLIEPQFSPYFDQFDITNLPNWNACVRTTVDGQVVAPFTMETILDAPVQAGDARSEVLARSRQRYARPRAEVEAQIAASMAAPPPATEDILEADSKDKLKIILLEDDPEVIGRIQQSIAPRPLVLVSTATKIRDAVPTNDHSLVFLSVDLLAKKKGDMDLDSVLLLLSFNEANRRSVVVPYSAKLPIDQPVKGKQATGEVLTSSLISFAALRQMAREAGSFRIWLRSLLKMLEEVNKPGAAPFRIDADPAGQAKSEPDGQSPPLEIEKSSSRPVASKSNKGGRFPVRPRPLRKSRGDLVNVLSGHANVHVQKAKIT